MIGQRTPCGCPICERERAAIGAPTTSPPPLAPSTDDLGSAAVFAHLHGPTTRFFGRRWWRWSASRWQALERHEALALAVEVARWWGVHAQQLHDDIPFRSFPQTPAAASASLRSERVSAWARKMAGLPRISACLRLAESEPAVQCQAGVWAKKDNRTLTLVGEPAPGLPGGRAGGAHG